MSAEWRINRHFAVHFLVSDVLHRRSQENPAKVSPNPGLLFLWTADRNSCVVLTIVWTAQLNVSAKPWLEMYSSKMLGKARRSKRRRKYLLFLRLLRDDGRKIKAPLESIAKRAYPELTKQFRTMSTLTGSGTRGIRNLLLLHPIRASSGGGHKLNPVPVFVHRQSLLVPCKQKKVTGDQLFLRSGTDIDPLPRFPESGRDAAGWDDGIRHHRPCSSHICPLFDRRLCLPPQTPPPQHSFSSSIPFPEFRVSQLRRSGHNVAFSRLQRANIKILLRIYSEYNEWLRDSEVSSRSILYLGLVFVCPRLQHLGLVEQMFPSRFALAAHATQTEEILLDSELFRCERRKETINITHWKKHVKQYFLLLQRQSFLIKDAIDEFSKTQFTNELRWPIRNFLPFIQAKYYKGIWKPRSNVHWKKFSFLFQINPAAGS